MQDNSEDLFKKYSNLLYYKIQILNVNKGDKINICSIGNLNDNEKSIIYSEIINLIKDFPNDYFDKCFKYKVVVIFKDKSFIYDQVYLIS